MQMEKKNEIWWYWNSKTKTSPTQKTYFNKANTDTNKIVVSNKLSLVKKGFKYFIGYNNAKIRPWCIFLAKISRYRRDFDKIK